MAGCATRLWSQRSRPSFAGDRMVRWLGHQHAVRPQLTAHVDCMAGGSRRYRRRRIWRDCGVVCLDDSSCEDRIGPDPLPPISRRSGRRGRRSWIDAVGREYLSLSLPLAADALAGLRVAAFAWLAKSVFTSVSLGGGLPGGEVTPLFVVGADSWGGAGWPTGAPSTTAGRDRFCGRLRLAPPTPPLRAHSCSLNSSAALPSPRRRSCARWRTCAADTPASTPLSASKSVSTGNCAESADDPTLCIQRTRPKHSRNVLTLNEN